MRYRNLIIQKNYYIIGMNYFYSSANKSRGEQKNMEKYIIDCKQTCSQIKC